MGGNGRTRRPHKKLRTKHMRYGKEKLRRLYKKRYKEDISTWKIERVIRAYKLYPDKKKHILIQKKKARSATKPKKRIQQIQKAATFGHLWHIDSIIINWYGHRRALITALEEQTKIAYARRYPTNTSHFASDFLKRLTYLIDAQITIIHSDNGTEFAGLFEKACKELGIEQVYSRPHQPKDNAVLERFNRAIQEEW